MYACVPPCGLPISFRTRCSAKKSVQLALPTAASNITHVILPWRDPCNKANQRVLKAPHGHLASGLTKCALFDFGRSIVGDKLYVAVATT